MTFDTSNWHWPQYVFIIGSIISLSMNALRNGEDMKLKYNIGMRFVVLGTWYFVFISGGFFK